MHSDGVSIWPATILSEGCIPHKISRFKYIVEGRDLRRIEFDMTIHTDFRYCNSCRSMDDNKDRCPIGKTCYKCSKEGHSYVCCHFGSGQTAEFKKQPVLLQKKYLLLVKKNPYMPISK